MANDIIYGNPVQAAQQGFQYGRQMSAQNRQLADQNQLRQLAPGIISGDPNALSQASAINPEAAGQYAQAGDSLVRKLKGGLALIDSAQDPRAKQAYWEQVRPFFINTAPPGTPEPPVSYEEAAPHLQGAKAKIAMIDQVPSKSAGFLEFQAQARAAGLQEGTPEYENAAKIALGVNPRAVTGAIKFGETTDANGNPRPTRSNPSSGIQEVFQAETNQWVPLGSGVAQTAPAQASPPIQANASYQTPGGIVRINDVAPEDMAAVYADMQANGAQNSYNLPPRTTTAPAGALGVGRSKEREAAAIEAAKLGVNNANFGNQLAQETALAQAKGNVEVGVAGSKARMENQTKLTQDQATRQKDANSTLDLLSQAEPLLAKATGSRAGSLYDQAAGMVGQSTEGAQATAQLQTIAGQLTSKMPRMQGPQSDRDVQLYQQMAGDLANPTIPAATRLAALQTIRQLNQKYAGQQSAAPSNGGWSIKPKP